MVISGLLNIPLLVTILMDLLVKKSSGPQDIKTCSLMLIVFKTFGLVTTHQDLTIRVM
jgi:hypothetical protein